MWRGSVAGERLLSTEADIRRCRECQAVSCVVLHRSDPARYGQKRTFALPVNSLNRMDRAWARSERLKRFGYWSCALGMVLLLLGVAALGVLPSMNPKSTTSVYATLEGTRYLSWLSLPLVLVSVLFVVAGLVMLALARQISRETQ